MTSLQSLIDLSGKTAVVTGGARGIGLGIARRLREAGANLVIADIDAAAVDLAAKELGALAVTTDVTRETDVLHLLESTLQAYGSVGILVNNAGLCSNTATLAMTVEDFDRVIAVSLRGSSSAPGPPPR